MGRSRTVCYDQVATVVQSAQTSNVSARARVAETFELSLDAAQQLIKRARDAGFEVPHLKRGPKTDTIVERLPALPKPVLCCVDCPATFFVDRSEDLNLHTWREHRRGPLREERTPSTRGVHCASDLNMFGPNGTYLASRGWTIQPRLFRKMPLFSTAWADYGTRTMWVRQDKLARPDAHLLRYVLPHECWHGVTFEVVGAEPEGTAAARVDLAARRKALSVGAFWECVADAGVLQADPSLWEQNQVKASVRYHSGVGLRYRYATLSDPAIIGFVSLLRAGVDKGGTR